MFFVFEKTIIGMAFLRFISGGIELFVAYLFLKYNDVEKALILNSSLALIGPIVLIITTTLGLMGISDKISMKKLIFIVGGVASILYGVKSN